MEKVRNRKLDALIAKHVMDLDIEWRDKTISVGEYGDTEYDVSNYFIKGRQHSPIREYSTNISSAWEVVEHLRGDREWSFYLDADHVCHEGVGFRASFGMYSAEATTAPEAICRAALAAKDVEIPNE